MNTLEIVQSLHHESKLPGSPPSAVTGQTGRSADLVRWVVQAWNDIQRARAGRWKWLRGNFYFNTVADTQGYAYTDCTDTDAAATISRFRAWHMDEREPPLIYLVADGQSSERWLAIADWTRFRDVYRRGTHTAGPPQDVGIDAADTLFLGPTPDDIYRVTGNYWKSNQTLADDDDIPECPVDYHMLIVWRAITKYAYNVVAHEILARARSEGDPLYEELADNQGYARFSMQPGSALA